MGIYSYFFGKSVKETKETKESVKEPEPERKIEVSSRPGSKKRLQNLKVFIVANKQSDTILGVYDDLELAKKNGQKTSFFNCRITEFKLNNCGYLNNVVFEDK